MKAESFMVKKKKQPIGIESFEELRKEE